MALKQPGNARMPRWIWSEPKRQLPISVKRFAKFIWRFGPQGCPWWNCVLARYFKVTPRTIRRWIHWLKYYPLIAIAYPDGRNRVIRRLPYYDRATFERQRPLWLDALRRTQMSTLDNAQQKKSYTTSSSSSAAAAERSDPQQQAAEARKTRAADLSQGLHPRTPARGSGVKPDSDNDLGEIEYRPGDLAYIFSHRDRYAHFTDWGCDHQEATILLLAEKDLEWKRRRKPLNR